MKSYNSPFEHVNYNAILDGTQDNGVKSGLIVTERGAGQNMSVDVAIGSTIISDIEYSETGVTNIVITAADLTNPRKDIIIYDVATTTPIVITGVAATEPIPPDITSGDILLAIVNVGANVSLITNSNIEDGRIHVNPQYVYSPSTAILQSNDALATTYSHPAYTKIKETKVTMGRAENLRIVFTTQGGGGGYNTYAAYLYKNGVNTGIGTSGTIGTPIVSEGYIVCENDDLLQIYGRGTGVPAYYVRVTNFRILGEIVLARSSISAVNNL